MSKNEVFKHRSDNKHRDKNNVVKQERKAIYVRTVGLGYYAQAYAWACSFSNLMPILFCQTSAAQPCTAQNEASAKVQRKEKVIMIILQLSFNRTYLDSLFSFSFPKILVGKLMKNLSAF